MPTIKDSSSIEEVLQYIVACYGEEIYQEKQRLSNLIADLYTGEERLKRLYRRMVMEDAVSLQLYSISLKPIQEREGFYNRLVYQFKEANFLDEAFARQSLDAFLHGMNRWLVEPISTKATEEDGEWVDEYGVKYSADRRKLIEVTESFSSSNYSIKEGTEIICDLAFECLSELENIIIPESVIAIGCWAFMETGLVNVEIPDSVKNIGDGAFVQCNRLLKVKLSSNLTTIERGVFEACESLKEIDIPKNVKVIKDEAFSECYELITVKLPDSLVSIGNAVFSLCCLEEGLIIPNSVKTIGRSVFYYCDFTEIKIPNSVKSIGSGTFAECLNLKKIILSENMEILEPFLFEGCEALSSLNIPNNVTKIAEDAFVGTTKLSTIYLNNKTFKTKDEALYTSDMKKILYVSRTTRKGKYIIIKYIKSK